jgi:hypothetical protein
MAACFCSTDKRYSGDNRLMVPQRRHRRNRLAPRCRLTPSRGCRRSQGLDCSSIKGVRELGLDRRESGWPLSTAAGGALGEGHLRTKGAGGGGRWCSGRAFAKASSRSYAAGPDGATNLGFPSEAFAAPPSYAAMECSRQGPPQSMLRRRRRLPACPLGQALVGGARAGADDSLAGGFATGPGFPFGNPPGGRPPRWGAGETPVRAAPGAPNRPRNPAGGFRGRRAMAADGGGGGGSSGSRLRRRRMPAAPIRAPVGRALGYRAPQPGDRRKGRWPGESQLRLAADGREGRRRPLRRTAPQ